MYESSDRAAISRQSIAAARTPRARALRALLGTIVLLFCGARSNGAASDRDAELRAGDTLLDHLGIARIEQFPASNLPDAIRRAATKSFRMRTPEIGGPDWIGAGVLPQELAGFKIEPDSKRRYWMIKPAIHPSAGGDPVTILRHGVRMPASDPSWTELPDPYVRWDEKLQSLYALSEKRVTGVVVEYSADPAVVFAPFERGGFDAAARAGEAPPPEPASLLHRFEVGLVSRSCLMLPAPGAVAFALPRVDFDEMRVAVAVVDLALRQVEGCFVRSRHGSDGVTFGIDVVNADGRARREWSQSVGREEVGARFLEGVVDLKPYRGRAVTLRLATEPGAAGDSSFDYSIWSDLRLLGAPDAKPTRPNVVIVDVDTLRADRLSCYGNPRRTSPHLDAQFAKDAVVYRDVLSSACWTLPSTASILTGMHVQQHGVKRFPQAVGAGTPMLASMLRAEGYETYAIAEGGYMAPAFGFDQGFDLYDETRHKNPDWKQALDWIGGRRSERPFFLFLHTFAVHAPYEFDGRYESECTPPYDGWLAGKAVGYGNVIEPYCKSALELKPEDMAYINRLYDALVARMDERVGAFVEELDQALREQDYVLVFTSDHGEEFFEHRRMGHGHSLYDELLHVPLAIRYPRAIDPRPAPGFRDDPVASIDIAPTIFECVGLPKPDYMPGRSLLRGVDDPSPRIAFRNEQQQTIVWNGFKLIRTLRSSASQGEPRIVEKLVLYELANDPLERTNVFASHRPIAAKLRDRLDLELRTWKYQERFGGDEASSERIDGARLRELGYAGGEGGAEATNGDEPAAKKGGRRRGE